MCKSPSDMLWWQDSSPICLLKVCQNKAKSLAIIGVDNLNKVVAGAQPDCLGAWGIIFIPGSFICLSNACSPKDFSRMSQLCRFLVWIISEVYFLTANNIFTHLSSETLKVAEKIRRNFQKSSSLLKKKWGRRKNPVAPRWLVEGNRAQSSWNRLQMQRLQPFYLTFIHSEIRAQRSKTCYSCIKNASKNLQYLSDRTWTL